MVQAAIVTCADDRMIEFFKLWAHAIKMTGTKLPVIVVPFTENCERIGEICSANNFAILESTPNHWVEVGREIYREERYRAESASANYFAKLGVFDVPYEILIYFDTNAIPFEDPKHVLAEFLVSGKDILFEWQVSGIGRNVADEETARKLNALNLDIGVGWGMQAFVAHTSAVTLDLAIKICSRHLREELGSAPEQSFLTRYIAEHRVQVGQTRRYYKASVGASCRSRIRNTRDSLEVDIKNGVRKVRFVKWNGPSVTERLPNYWILERLQKGLE